MPITGPLVEPCLVAVDEACAAAAKGVVVMVAGRSCPASNSTSNKVARAMAPAIDFLLIDLFFSKQLVCRGTYQDGRWRHRYIWREEIPAASDGVR
jgi:hypothetical protein